MKGGTFYPITITKQLRIQVLPAIALVFRGAINVLPPCNEGTFGQGKKAKTKKKGKSFTVRDLSYPVLEDSPAIQELSSMFFISLL